MLRGEESFLARLTLAWILPAVVLSALELGTSGRLSGPVIALDSVAAMLLPFGILSVVLARTQLWDDPPPSDGESGGGGGGSKRHPEPLPPSGGLGIEWDLGIDWDRFDAERRAWEASALAQPDRRT